MGMRIPSRSVFFAFFSLSSFLFPGARLAAGVSGDFSFSNASSAWAFYRSAQLVEITGNEQTIAALARSSFHFQKELAPGTSFSADVAVLLQQGLSQKGRLFAEMNPPILSPESLALSFRAGDHEVRFGRDRPLGWQWREDGFSPPLFQRGAVSSNFPFNHALTDGWRDLPLPYAGILPNFDTGLWWHWRPGSFHLALGVANGEEGLDANSDKAFSLLVAHEGERLRAGLVVEEGEYGSVPIKEWQYFAKLFFGTRTGPVRFGAEGLFVIGGLKITNSLNLSDSQYGSGIQNWFGYGNGFYNSFTTWNPGSNAFLPGLPTSMVPEALGVFWISVPSLFHSNWSLDFHGSVWDPNLGSDALNWQQPKARAHAALRFRPWKDVEWILSDTFTYDPYYLSEGSFYFDREPRILHHRLDNDVFFGVRATFTGSSVPGP